MSKYVDANEVVKTLTNNQTYSATVLQAIIDRIPKADVEPVRHGHWVWMGESGCKCSLCKKRIRIRERRTFEYCPKCGAKMDGKEEDEEIKNV